MYIKITNPGSECMGCLVGQLLVCLGAAGEGREKERINLIQYITTYKASIMGIKYIPHFDETADQGFL